MTNWYEVCDIPRHWPIKTTDNGWTTNEAGLEWIKHFDKYTTPRTRGKYRLLILDGHESHHSAEFELYCQAYDIITLCMPLHSSHLLQPLDVGCFRPLKQLYGRQIKGLIYMYITYISKLEFLSAFQEAFFASIIDTNIQGGFIGAGLIPYNPERVISKLDIQLQTPTPSNSRPGTSHTWVSKTLQNPLEADSQTCLIKSRVSNHQNSSPTAILNAINQFTKGAKVMMHKVALLHTKVSTLYKANKALSKHRRAKRIYIQHRGILTIQDIEELQVQQDVGRQEIQGIYQSSGQVRDRFRKLQCCSICRQPGHTARTYQEV